MGKNILNAHFFIYHFITFNVPIKFLANSAVASQTFLLTGGVSSSCIPFINSVLTPDWSSGDIFGHHSLKSLVNKRRNNTAAKVRTCHDEVKSNY